MDIRLVLTEGAKVDMLKMSSIAIISFRQITVGCTDL